MAATPEGKVKRALERMLKEEGVWSYAPQAGPYGAAGIPDRIGCANGYFFGVECKADRSKQPTALQLKRRDEILAAGGAWFLVYDSQTIDTLRAWLRACTRRQEETGSESEEP